MSCRKWSCFSRSALCAEDGTWCFTCEVSIKQNLARGLTVTVLVFIKSIKKDKRASYSRSENNPLIFYGFERSLDINKQETFALRRLMMLFFLKGNQTRLGVAMHEIIYETASVSFFRGFCLASSSPPSCSQKSHSFIIIISGEQGDSWAFWPWRCFKIKLQLFWWRESRRKVSKLNSRRNRRRDEWGLGNVFWIMTG